MAKIFSFREFKNMKAEKELNNDPNILAWISATQAVLKREQDKQLRRQWEAHLIHSDETQGE